MSFCASRRPCARLLRAAPVRRSAPADLLPRFHPRRPKDDPEMAGLALQYVTPLLQMVGAACQTFEGAQERSSLHSVP